jgi:putative aminopeptidase
MSFSMRTLLGELMAIAGLSGHEGRVRRYISGHLEALGLETRTDRLGNLMATIKGNSDAPSVLLIAHMDQLGFIVRRIEDDGMIRVERLGGVPERALASQAVLICVGEGRDLPAVIGNKSHHATDQQEKYKVLPYAELYIDAGFSSAKACRKAGVQIGTPIVYAPQTIDLAGGRVAGTSIDDRAACAVLIKLAETLAPGGDHPTIELLFSVQEEFNLRGALPPAQTLGPDIAIQLDLVLATDAPGMGERGEVLLGGGPAMSLYSFHGRGTLNGTLAHPALVNLFERTADGMKMPLQRSAQVGVLTETSYVQLVGEGVAAIDMGFPCRYTHSSLEVCDLGDLEDLASLLMAAMGNIGADFSLDRDGFE